jgi:hypothetical protein
MEDVLDVYKRPYDPSRPVVCFDEATKQLLADVTPPVPMSPGLSQRTDYEYERRGTANIFMQVEPLAGRRYVDVTDQRRAIDFAEQIRLLVDERYPEADKIVLVMDNLNVHCLGSLYEAFSPELAWRLAQKLEIHYTPKHGSWLNMAEIELSVLGRQCLNRRLPDKPTVACETRSWEADRNMNAAKINWQFDVGGARHKLRRLYPTYSS